MFLGNWILLLSLAQSKGGGGKGGGSRGGSSGGSSGGGASSSGGFFGGSSKASGSFFPARTTTTSSSTRSVFSGPPINFGSRNVYGFPGNRGFYGGYGMSSYFLYYYLFASTHNHYYSSTQSSRTNGNCISFGESTNDTARLIVGDGINGDTQMGPGERKVRPPYDVEDNVNFVGDGTFTANVLSVTFEGTTTDFRDRLASAQALNTTTLGDDLDVRASTLITQMWSVPPFMNASRIEMVSAKIALRGSMFSFADLIVYVGDFNTPNGTFIIDGFATSFNSTSNHAIKLGYVTNVYTAEKENGISTVTVVVNSPNGLKPSALGFQNLNVTVGSHIISQFGDFSYKGASLEMNSCDDNGSFGCWFFLGIFILLAFLCCGAFIMYRKRQKKIFVQQPAWNGNEAYMNNQTYSNPPNYFAYHNPTELNGGQISPSQNIYGGYQNQFDPINNPQADQFPPPIHNVNDAREDSLLRSNQFYDIFPIDSPAAMAEAQRTASLPSSILNSQSKYTMMEPRLHSAFPFYSQQPTIRIGTMSYPNGIQEVEFETNQDVSIQSNQPLLPHQELSRGFENDQCYYEVKISHMDSSVPITIAIGYASIPYPSFRLPGWDRNSIAFHSDDGAVFVNDVDYGTPSGHGKLKAGDVIGAGYYVVKNGETIVCKFYFTVNGERLIQEYSDIGFEPAKIYPTVGSDSNCKLEVSFGNVEKVFFPLL